MKWKILPGLFALTCISAFSQTAPDTAFITSAKHYAIQLHHEALGTQSRLYNGSKYRDPDMTFEEHPFFVSEDWLMGSVFYDGEHFDNVALMYDIATDQLVTEHLPSGHPIQLIREKLPSFTIDGHVFENIQNESVANSLPRTGFYEVLYNGNTKLLALRVKFRRDKVESMQIYVIYEAKNRYFVLRNGVYFPVKSKASAMKLMDDKRTELKKMLKQNRISFRENRELALKRLAEFYDTLQ